MFHPYPNQTRTEQLSPQLSDNFTALSLRSMVDFLAKILERVRMRTVSCPFDTTHDHILGHRFQIVGLPNLVENINGKCGHVHRIIAQFGGFVIPGKHVMIVVPSFSWRQECNDPILSRVDSPWKETGEKLNNYCASLEPIQSNPSPLHSLVVRMIAPDVGSAVHQPGSVQREHVTENWRHEEGSFKILPPIVPRYPRRQEERNQQNQRYVEPE